jgi:hypothetical protein
MIEFYIFLGEEQSILSLRKAAKHTSLSSIPQRASRLGSQEPLALISQSLLSFGLSDSII